MGAATGAAPAGASAASAWGAEADSSVGVDRLALLLRSQCGVLGATIHGHVTRGLLPGIGRRGCATEQRSIAQRCQTFGDGVDGGGGHHEQAEAENHDEPQVRQPDPDGCHDRCRDQPADPPAGCAQRLGAICRGGRALGQRPDATRGGKQDGAADSEPAGGRPLVGVAQHTQGGPEQEHRDHDIQGPEQASDDRRDHTGEPAVDGEPCDRGHHDGRGEQQQADPVATMCRVDVAGASANGTGQPAEDGGQEQPDPGQEPTEGAHDLGHGARLTALHLLGCRPGH